MQIVPVQLKARPSPKKYKGTGYGFAQINANQAGKLLKTWHEQAQALEEAESSNNFIATALKVIAEFRRNLTQYKPVIGKGRVTGGQTGVEYELNCYVIRRGPGEVHGLTLAGIDHTNDLPFAVYTTKSPHLFGERPTERPLPSIGFIMKDYVLGDHNRLISWSPTQFNFKSMQSYARTGLTNLRQVGPLMLQEHAQDQLVLYEFTHRLNAEGQLVGVER